jgi:ADP-ribosylglycohydrolase
MTCQPLSEGLLREELTALAEEGFDVSSPTSEMDAIAGRTDDEAARRRGAIEDGLASLPRRADFHSEEPSDLDGIRAARPDGPRAIPLKIGKAALADKTRGAWLGRSAGCLLGKPCEGWHRRDIEETLRAVGEWPLSDYWPVLEHAPEGVHYRPPTDASLRQNITRMTRDDDMDYPILGLHILEAYGPGFATPDVGSAWLHSLPYACTYTAESVAYRNLVDGTEPPHAARYRNPYREWIGAQIRADIWGWVAPGRPEHAAELAHRDAALSHTKNGIYGEMFFAALLASAFVESNLHTLIEIGLSEIPHNCRLREAVLDTVDWCGCDPDWEATWERINQKYGHYHGVHTINNAAVVLMGLLHGRGDFERAIAIAVMGGWDTDCNGATAGSVMGVILGAKALPVKWIAPLHDRISSIVAGFNDVKLSALARRTTAMQQRVLGQPVSVASSLQC